MLMVLVVALVSAKTPRDHTHVELLHDERAYAAEFMQPYRVMIGSLLLGTPMLANRELLRQKGERSTSATAHGGPVRTISRCSFARLNRLQSVRVLQPEDDNWVTLLRDARTGRFYVSKLVQHAPSFHKEMEFYARIGRGARFFPRLVCGGHVAELGGWVVLMEHVDGRESEIMASRATGAQLRHMAAQLLLAVAEMHHMGYLHADIKPGNVLVTDDYRVYLIDFGMVTRVQDARGNRGNPHVRAPELQGLVPGPLAEGIDWWAYGATVAIWYYYQLQNLQKGHVAPWFPRAGDAQQLHHQLKLARDGWSPSAPKTSFPERARRHNRPVRYAFTPLLWRYGRFEAQRFPPALGAVERSFLALFFTADSELRAFNTARLLALLKGHALFADIEWDF